MWLMNDGSDSRSCSTSNWLDRCEMWKKEKLRMIPKFLAWITEGVMVSFTEFGDNGGTQECSFFGPKMIMPEQIILQLFFNHLETAFHFCSSLNYLKLFFVLCNSFPEHDTLLK